MISSPVELTAFGGRRPLLRIRHAQIHEIMSPGTIRAVIAVVRRSLATRVAHLDDDALHSLALRAVERAGRLGLHGPRVLARFFGATLLLGEGFEDDPARPWACHAMASSSDPKVRLDRLFAAMRRQAARIFPDYPP